MVLVAHVRPGSAWRRCSVTGTRTVPKGLPPASVTAQSTVWVTV